MAVEIISYADAKAKGLKRYFTGKPCKRGHIVDRFVASCACTACTAMHTDKWIAENPDASKIRAENGRKFRAKNPEYGAEWVKANPNSRRVIAQKWYQKDPKSSIDRVTQWRNDNPEKARAIVRNRAALRAKAEGKHTAEEITAMLKKQKWKCVGCGASIKAKHHIDHIVPLSRGGRNDISNLQGLCVRCNCSKNAKLPEDWARERGLLI